MTGPELEALCATVLRVAQTKPRILVAIAGPPGSGKSTLAKSLADAIPGASVLPMDGFHLDNETLSARGLLRRKGAPETFDAEGFSKLLARVAKGGEVAVPTFDRARDCVVPEGASIAAEVRVVLVEGNYLLLNAPGWDALQDFWDLTIMLEVPEEVLEQRLVQRWLDHGMAPDAATARARGNDLANARVVRDNSFAATINVTDGA